MKSRVAFAVALAFLVPSPALADQIVLRAGSTGPAVSRWQAILNEYIAAGQLSHVRQPLAVDGIFGPKTSAATRSYEDGSRMRPDGIVGVREREIWVGSNTTCCGAGYPTVGPGSVSPQVGWWQETLNKWLKKQPGSTELLIDGVFGPRTEEATRDYQGAAGIVVDGIAGPKTWTAAQ
jgi:peptidoglycan hydrolase-like protein with peptidoglycan-binding domain